MSSDIWKTKCVVCGELASQASEPNYRNVDGLAVCRECHENEAKVALDYLSALEDTGDWETLSRGDAMGRALRLAMAMIDERVAADAEAAAERRNESAEERCCSNGRCAICRKEHGTDERGRAEARHAR